jgi:uncharacterized protein YndB with AHSA1/START domain
MMRAALAMMSALGALGVDAAHAKVVTAVPAGFDIGDTVEIAAPPGVVWATLMKPSSWWNPQHSWSGDAANLSIDPRPGGCFCESLPGGGVQHLTVVFVQPEKLLRLRGALGPLQDEGADGPLSFALESGGVGTVLKWSYRVGGYLRGGGEKWGPLVDMVLAEQIARLKVAAEKPRG